MSQTKEAPKTKVITGPVRLSYAHIFQPHAVEEGQDKKYSCSLIIPKSDKKTINAINEAVKIATEEGKAKFGNKIPANLKLPLRDGDEERGDDPVYKNSFFINASSATKPGLVDKNRSQIMSEEDMYSGCFVIASINLYAFNKAGNKGIAAGLNNLMKWKDGEKLSGRASAEDDFADVAIDDDSDDFL